MIEFLESEHIYLKDGIIVPSVTQILQMIFPDKYKGINESILNRKAKFGTQGHAIIENLDVSDVEKAKSELLELYEKKVISQELFICLREYVRLVIKHKIEPLEHEKIVSYKNLFCGKLDMIANINGKRCLCDIKFTSECDEEYLSWQLGMYKMALGEEFEEYYCIWLPKRDLAKLVKIVPKTEKEILAKLKELGLC